jgi:hypothetical protein
MLRISAETKLKPEEVLKKAMDFFGPGGDKMKVLEKSEGCVTFEGGGGMVSVTTQPAAKNTTVEIVTQEWEEPVKEFMRRIKT